MLFLILEFPTLDPTSALNPIWNKVANSREEAQAAADRRCKYRTRNTKPGGDYSCVIVEIRGYMPETSWRIQA